MPHALEPVKASTRAADGGSPRLFGGVAQRERAQSLLVHEQEHDPPLAVASACRVGLGSFNETGSFRNVKITGIPAKPH